MQLIYNLIIIYNIKYKAHFQVKMNLENKKKILKQYSGSSKRVIKKVNLNSSKDNSSEGSRSVEKILK